MKRRIHPMDPGRSDDVEVARGRLGRPAPVQPKPEEPQEPSPSQRVRRRRFGGLAVRVSAGAVVVILMVGALAPGAFAHVTSDFTHLWNDHIKPLLSSPGTINDPANPVDWTKLKGVPAGLADGIDNGVDNAGFGLTKTPVIGGGTAFTVDTTKVQKRVTGSCVAGQTISSVMPDGSVTCNAAAPTVYEHYVGEVGNLCGSWVWCIKGTLNLPAGSFAIFARVDLYQPGGGPWGGCRLAFNGRALDSADSHPTDSLYEYGISLQRLVTTSTKGTATVECQGWNDIVARHVQLMAIRVTP